MGLELKTLKAMVGACLLAGLACLAGCGDDPPTSSAAPAAKVRQFNMKEFDNYAYGRTKAQIRSEFGPPDLVHEDTDTWYYTSVNDRLVVYDPDAGTRAEVSVRFSGLDGPTDTVEAVEY